MSNFEDEFRDDEAIVREVEQRGAMRERERIIELIKGTPVAFEWFQPFVGTTTLIQQINEETNGKNV